MLQNVEQILFNKDIFFLFHNILLQVCIGNERSKKSVVTQAVVLSFFYKRKLFFWLVGLDISIRGIIYLLI
jgi:hypothetical protein